VRVILVALFLLLSNCCVFAQSPNGSIRGIVFDPDAKSIAGAEVIVVNDATSVKYVTSTNAEGLYAVENLPPGPYRIQVSKFGFKGIIKPDIILNVQDVATLNFTLPIGASSVVVTVEGGAPLINTQSSAVSTVVDRNFVANTPLNGRSFQDLILLTPGVVTATPQTLNESGASGEFSVNGQRTESNYYTVDGVSANAGLYIGAPQFAGTSTSLPSATALGTTQSLVSVDALEEFRVQSSTYSAEYGRTPGGQFSFVTRSGTNIWRGSAFEYLRNSAFDANDWFSNYYQQKPTALRQNDFGGTLGGPITLPRLYDGKDRTFFFFSYEGVRLLQPKPSSVSYVPSLALRQSAPTALAQVLDAFPTPTPGTPDPGNGLSEFVGTWSDPSRIDAVSLRLDHSLNERTKISFRFSDTPSRSDIRSMNNPAVSGLSQYSGSSYRFSLTDLVTPRVGNEFRLNYSGSQGTTFDRVESFGGSQAIDLAALQGINLASNPNYQVGIYLYFPGTLSPVFAGSLTGQQRQWNVVDSVSASLGRHQLKWGVDYRRSSPIQKASSPQVGYYFFGESSVQANSVDAVSAQSQSAAYPVFNNLSVFAQDAWRVSPRLTLLLGVRWEVNPAPGAPNGNAPYTVSGNNLSTLKLAPEGTPLWNTTWFNFAPRLGLAYVLNTQPGHETVLRGGAGVFFDTGQQLGSYGYLGPGFAASTFYGGVPFPISPAEANPAVVNPPAPPYGFLYAFAPHLQLPYTLEWNVSVEQAMGKSQVLRISYVGANGRKLLQEGLTNAGAFNPDFSSVVFIQNGLTSNYQALEAQLQRRIASGLQVLASYTFSHAIDFGSQNAAYPYVRGNSDYDVRHNFSGAISYEIPGVSGNRFVKATLHHWAVDGRFTARSGFPVPLNGNGFFQPATNQFVYAGLNLVPGEPIYLSGPQYPGGRAVSPAAFVLPGPGQFGDAPRNLIRGFGAWQADFAVRREFPVYERLKLQFRAEAFNVFNHPNFGTINKYYGDPQFGLATGTLAQGLGVLSPLYQMGGPRSMQLALKLMF
jgi:Carboxypeptidase regulatory-like domain/TonB dependent receptor/TonB-dependent Receptor Plug Domain